MNKLFICQYTIHIHYFFVFLRDVQSKLIPVNIQDQERDLNLELQFRFNPFRNQFGSDLLQKIFQMDELIEI